MLISRRVSDSSKRTEVYYLIDTRLERAIPSVLELMSCTTERPFEVELWLARNCSRNFSLIHEGQGKIYMKYFKLLRVLETPGRCPCTFNTVVAYL
jgi:hypothetical protein